MTEDQNNQSLYASNLPKRHRVGKLWLRLFQACLLISILSLAILLVNIINNAFGYIAVEDTVDPASLAIDGIPLEEMTQDQLALVFQENVSGGLYRRYDTELALEDRTWEDVYQLIQEKVIEPEVAESWSLTESIFLRKQIVEEINSEYPGARLKFTSWLDWQFLSSTQSDRPILAGVRTAVLGSIWTIAITILFALPLGVGAAIYLQEYAGSNRLNQVIQININNLAGVPSIIYGMLGLAIFVRMLVSLTSGAALGLSDPSTSNGRTILSAGLTLGLLVLPIIIINAQEAIRAVPSSLRQAALGVGATRWQMIWHHVLPSAMPGILTGTILAISRAIGETAPLVVVGAATFITLDPNGPFSKFTSLPIQIYQWTARPQAEFRNMASAAILILLVMLLSLNAAAILLRNRYHRSQQ